MSGRHLTAQGIFDRVVERLRDGTGAALLNGRGTCVYLTKDGRKCAVGIFLPDGHPGQGFIGGVRSLIERFEDLEDLREHVGLLSDLQNIHDTVDFWNGKEFDGVATLSRIARDHFLDDRAVRS